LHRDDFGTNSSLGPQLPLPVVDKEHGCTVTLKDRTGFAYHELESVGEDERRVEVEGSANDSFEFDDGRQQSLHDLAGKTDGFQEIADEAYIGL
jgi:hypothetical protein